ncbi:hypothetical protein Cgig2_027854 [Carnegiea gigantea]|uniref:Uncharacterized protein n=1 Tax=Carnegiea gigantea TaxID=171969 RepID=A0A9Q1JTP9_9CARY|nr:hypothetical protein Cgig2_027854 [Carnegiea gigantea]
MEYDSPKLRMRMSPYGLCSFLPSISDEQRSDIIELGFEFLLTLRADKIPSTLARWLVENFDTCRRAVKLASNEELRIMEEDVYLTMGFPRGSKPIQEAKKIDKGEYTLVLDEWKDQWGGVLPKTHQLCYVDRVLCKKMKIGIEFLILANWTSKDLWTRMNFQLESYQGFGKGIENDRIKASETPTLYIQEEEADVRAKKACVQKISRSLKNFACSVIKVVDVVSEAQHMFPASTQMDKVQGVLVEILTNCSKLRTFKDVAGTFTPPGFDLGFGFRLSQPVQVESPNQGGSGGVGGIGSGSLTLILIYKGVPIKAQRAQDNC